MFPDGSERGALPHGRRDALVLPRARPLPRRRPATASRSKRSCRRSQEIVRRHLEGTRFGIKVDPDGRAARPGRGGLSAHVDGREVRRLGRDAAARQGRRDQRALVQRAPPARRLDARGRATTARADELSGHAEQCRRSFNERFWYPEGGHLFDVVESRELAGADDPACRPNQLLAISLDTPRARRDALGVGRRASRARSC